MPSGCCSAHISHCTNLKHSKSTRCVARHRPFASISGWITGFCRIQAVHT
ncbi:hypothetical protein HMPREF0168_0727 [Bifidobacterium dentium ATCC 27679]|uniref:Uncharacterized protein n=2 Tax=Bifidobacterium dentium TaxID=1689 RepID=E0Q6G9_9BIFI|nr:hypothetical protein HMPREF0168_0727 [Bifidobacterium dentium ATCC 27679]EFO78832.1 hypothetical protein HMPREF9003_1124 [Bifidobacterium dentium JCVIHMP022]